MGNLNICLYKEVDKKYTSCDLKTMELLNCALIVVCAVVRSNAVNNWSEMPISTGLQTVARYLSSAANFDFYFFFLTFSSFDRTIFRYQCGIYTFRKRIMSGYRIINNFKRQDDANLNSFLSRGIIFYDLFCYINLKIGLLCGLLYKAICCMSFRVSFCSCVFQSF